MENDLAIYLNLTFSYKEIICVIILGNYKFLNTHHLLLIYTKNKYLTKHRTTYSTFKIVLAFLVLSILASKS